jgi:hypothetical protein
MKFVFKYLLPVVFLFLNSCRKHPEIPVKINRLEQSLFTLPIDSIQASIPHLEQQYGELFDLYSILMFRVLPKNPEYPEELTRFLVDHHMNLAYKRVMEVYPNLKDIESGLGRAFYNYHQEFPERVIPSVYTLVSGFGESILVADTILAIALDNYLGKNEDMYSQLELPNYRRQTMSRKYIVPNCMKEWMSTEFSYNDSIDNVLANILYEGKLMYALHRLLPNMPDSLIFGHTPDQTRWCRNNTAQMWTFLVDKKMLFSTDQLTINKLTGAAPFTSLFTPESPGRAVVWLGYKIIESYMKNNKVSLQALLEENDYQQILAKAKFRP